MALKLTVKFVGSSVLENISWNNKNIFPAFSILELEDLTVGEDWRSSRASDWQLINISVWFSPAYMYYRDNFSNTIVVFIVPP